jgi:hypothetical protein
MSNDKGIRWGKITAGVFLVIVLLVGLCGYFASRERDRLTANLRKIQITCHTQSPSTETEAKCFNEALKDQREP